MKTAVQLGQRNNILFLRDDCILYHGYKIQVSELSKKN